VVQSQPRQKIPSDPISKIPNTKKDWWSKVEEHQPSKHDALSTNLSTAPQNKTIFNFIQAFQVYSNLINMTHTNFNYSNSVCIAQDF
jgi:hypothetical protein